MKRFFFVSFLFFLFVGCVGNKKPYDIVIYSGKILNGTDDAEFVGDIGIRGDRIVKIGDIAESQGRLDIDAHEYYVAPGFIDVHTHVDRRIAEEPTVKNYLLQGVTTVVGGNCGGSELPIKRLFDELEKKGIAINFASYVGHNTVRREIMGNENCPPTAEQLAKMKTLVEQEMKAGAIGFSTGLAYLPGMFASTEELVELTKMIAPFGGIYATHLRNQGTHIQRAIEEAIYIGKKAGVTVDISHIKLSSESVWGEYHLITDPIEKARAEGMRVYMDQYPYIATSSGFQSSFPDWSVAGGMDSLAKRLENPELYGKIKDGIIRRRLSSERGINKLETIYITYNKNHPEYEGKNLAEILDVLGKAKTISNAADLIIEMQLSDSPRGVFFQMTEEDVETLMQKPYNMVASDGKIETPGVETPHPRAYGTFPRVIAKYVKERGVLSLPEAVRKMTSLPAEAMGFEDRGILKEGAFADIVIFNFEAIKDAATFENPHQYPEGIHWVLVNGRIAADHGKVLSKNGGRVLYGAGKMD